MFWFTTTGWMMWNFLVGCLLYATRRSCCTTAAPRHPDLGVLWELAERTGMTCMGVSAGLLASCEKAGIEPARDYDLQRAARDRLDRLAAGAGELPLGLRARQVETSGCSPRAAAPTCAPRSSRGCPLLPVYEGELQCRALGCAVEAWDEQGRSLVDEVGELVITEPMPSMPLFFWGDDRDGERLRESYFSMYPGVWRHGDWIRITPRGGAVIYGRSDSTINRQGVRMGTSEIYRAAGAVEEVLDALVVDVPARAERDAELWMVLFVVLARGRRRSTRSCSATIKRRIREDCSPRHVPNEILQIERGAAHALGQGAGGAGQAILMGAPPGEAASVDSLANPRALDYFVELVRSTPSLSRRSAGPSAERAPTISFMISLAPP